MIENQMVEYKEEEPEVIGHCSNCNEPLTVQDAFFDVNRNNEFLCGDDCIKKYFELRKVEGWELKW